jgi:hypothetical protein
MDSGPGDEMLLAAVADAIQDTFVAVWQKPGGFRGDGDIAAWLWAAPVDVQSSMLPVTSTARVGQQRRRRCSPNAHWRFADLLAVVGQLSPPVPALRQVS